ncbi:MAG TPA: PilZ domain-containing protein [Allosphingosinicella sp.]|nr:PilZ domain-containing protein [Allosphingosinicella sp.]
MSAETFIDGPVAGKRGARRSRVLLAARLQTPNGSIEARLRDLSRKGALVECQACPPVGAELVFSRGSTSIPARVAWSAGSRVGLEFAYPIDEQEVLIQLRRTTSDQNQPRFRRPRLGESMSEREKQIARLWGRSVGISLPAE